MTTELVREFTVAVFVVHEGRVLLLAHPKLGRWLPPGGHIEPNELPDEAAVREVEEETGIPRADYRASPHWDCVLAGRAVAMIRILQVDMPGEALRRRIEANLAGQQMPELSAIHLVRSASDLTAAMPRFVTAFIESQFAS